MKTVNKLVINLSVITVVFSLLGCAIKVEETIYLGDVKVDAPIITPPTHLNINKEAGDITISPRFSILTETDEIISSTGGRYPHTLTFNDSIYYKAKSKNFQWKPYRYTAGLDLDFMLFNGISLFGGMNLSGGGDKNLFGGNIGIGLHTNNGNPNVRLDIGVTIQEYSFDALTIVRTRTSSYWGTTEFVSFFADMGKITNINPFATLTINSSYDSCFINWYVAGGYFIQNLLGYEPGSYSYQYFPFVPVFGSYTQVDKRSDLSAGFLYLNAGMAFDLGQHFRLVVSAKMVNELAITSNKVFLIMPSAQIDFLL